MFISVNRCEVGQNPGKTAVMEVKEQFGINVHAIITVADIYEYLKENQNTLRFWQTWKNTWSSTASCNFSLCTKTSTDSLCWFFMFCGIEESFWSFPLPGKAQIPAVHTAGLHRYFE